MNGQEFSSRTKVFHLLMQSNYLSLIEYMNIHIAFNKKWTIREYVLNCEPQLCGPLRFLQWKTSLFENRQRLAALNSLYLNEYESLTGLDAVNSLSAIVKGEITRDVIRTFQTYTFFQSFKMGRSMLQNILSALAVKRKDIGYCQGMNFITAGLLVGRLSGEHTEGCGDPAFLTRSENKAFHNWVEHKEDPMKEIQLNEGSSMDSRDGNFYCKHEDVISCSERLKIERDVFMVMMELLEPDCKLSMYGLWRHETPHMKLRIFQLDRLLKWTHPRLHQHFDEIQVSPEILTAQWLMTLYAYTLPISTTLQIWDYIFIDGWVAVFKIAVSLLGFLESTIVQLDLEGIAQMIRDWKKEGQLMLYHALGGSIIPVKELINRADVLVINDEMLDKLRESFAYEIFYLAEVQYRLHVQSRRKLAIEANSSPSPREETSSPIEGNPVQLSEENGIEAKELDGLFLPSTEGSVAMEDRGGASMTPIEGGREANKVDLTDPLPSDNAMEKSLDHSLDDEAYCKPIQSSEYAIKMGEESPTFWLLRYGDNLSHKQCHDLRKIRRELAHFDAQMERDKVSIQEKIRKACEQHRAAQEALESAENEQCFWSDKVRLLGEEVHAVIAEAQLLAAEATAANQEEINLGTAQEPIPALQTSIQSTSQSSLKVSTPDDSIMVSNDGSAKSPHSLFTPDFHPSINTRNFSITTLDSIKTSSVLVTEDDDDEEIVQMQQQLENSFDFQDEEKEVLSNGGGGVVGTCSGGQHSDEGIPSGTSESETLHRVISNLIDSLVEDAIALSSEEQITGATGALSSHVVTDAGQTGEEFSPVMQPQPPLQQQSQGSGRSSNVLLSAKQFFFRPFTAATSSEANSPSFPMMKSEKLSHRMSRSMQALSSQILNRHRHFGLKSQSIQQRLIELNRNLDQSRLKHFESIGNYESAKVLEEEKLEWKERLCDQLQLLVEDANRIKSKKLLFVTENYLLT